MPSPLTRELIRKGWLRKMAGIKARSWIPTAEAKMMDCLQDMWSVVKDQAETDESAREIVDYVEGW